MAAVLKSSTMKKLFIALFAFAAVAAQAQTADEIVQKYTAAMGGLDAFQKVQTAKFTANLTVQGMDLPMTLQVINGKAMRMDVDVMGQSVTNSYKDGKGWKVNPFAGVETATDVEGAELAEFRSQANLASSLMNYKAQGHTLELLGQEAVDDKKAYKIRLTNKEDGKATTFYINTADYLILKSTTMRDIQGTEAEVETWFSNVKEFGGLKFYMTRDQKMNGQVMQSIAFTNVELNVPIDEKVFDK